MKKGFTLVELSIVLVIVGLLIGGILIGQSLIESAKLKNAINQYSQYDIAVSNFLGKFNQWPGDSSLFGTGGNNDGLLVAAEIGNQWYQLSSGLGLKNQKGGSYTPMVFNTTVVNEENCPVLKLDSSKETTNCLVISDVDLYSMYGNAFYPEGRPMRYRFYSEGASSLYGSANIWALEGPSKVKDVYALESKFDDGRPFSGILVSQNCNSGSSYRLQSLDDQTCTMWLEVGTFAGSDKN